MTVRFTDTNLPDVQDNSHIIGLCGVNDWPDSKGIHAADPSLDGWMLSDFYLLNHLFRGVAKSQAWFTCLDPSIMVERYGEFAHGNCYGSRRVVLDRDQLPDMVTLKIERPDDLIGKFLTYFRARCQIALSANESILLCVFCHGDELTHGLHIGGSDEEGPLLSVDEIASILSEFDGVQICLLMTSCFSGGWTITPKLRDFRNRSRATVMTAAGATEVSESWPRTTSLGRACGSLYVSALIKVLEEESTKEHEQKQSSSQTTEDFFDVEMDTKQFAAAITTQLLDVIDPRFGTTHKHKFEVQDDQWSSLYHERTGIPLSHYQARLEQLRVIPPRPLLDMRMDRSRSTLEIEAWEDTHPDAPLAVIAASNYGGSMHAVRVALQKSALKYIKSHPGRDSLAPNHRAHGLIRDAIENPHKLSQLAWIDLWDTLHYRLGSLQLAENLADRLGLHAPGVALWDKSDWDVKNVSTGLYDKAAVYWKIILDAGLFPTAPNSRKRYDKPPWYLAAMCVESGLSESELRSRLEVARTSTYYPLQFSFSITNMSAQLLKLR